MQEKEIKKLTETKTESEVRQDTEQNAGQDAGQRITHKSVLLNETINGLEISDGDVIVDMTLGNAGHTIGAIKSGAKKLKIIGIDADQSAIDQAKKNLNEIPEKNYQIFFETSYFDQLAEILEKNKIQKVDKFIFDLGFRSDQVDSAERGFSFMKDGPLDMSFSQNTTFDQNTISGQKTDDSTTTDSEKFRLNADIVVNEWSEESLADIIYGFGEETFSRRIAKAIVESRQAKRIAKTTELAEIIKQSVPFFYRRGKNHPATKTFQAIRIAVNGELDRLKKALPVAFEALNVDGRIAVISFHSLEDRIVKRFFKTKLAEEKLVQINKKPIIATREELLENPRSRSAKLRIIKKIN
ncbi:MAG TPA: 16S rRNA (cytosine(1402)-N(4))-methyltransferase RsmH [Candidatus Paceibacterota bacterium]|nr:16S rRNA (cytosine(1402)-N(4))-methyltransferase RsmH [Candidatus Paceibacterota bacterium]